MNTAITQEDQTQATKQFRRSCFLGAMTGIPAHHVRAALQTVTASVKWGVSKSDMAAQFADQENDNATRLNGVEIDRIAYRAELRMKCVHGWDRA